MRNQRTRNPHVPHDRMLDVPRQAEALRDAEKARAAMTVEQRYLREFGEFGVNAEQVAAFLQGGEA